MPDNFLESYQSQVLVWREMLLFSPDVALKLVDDCEHSGVRILGYDVFEAPVGDTIRCRLEACLDVSTKEYWDYSIEELCEVIRVHMRTTEGLLFEFVLS